MRQRTDDLTPVRLRVKVLAVLVGVVLPIAVDWIAGFVTYHIGDYRDTIQDNGFRINADSTGFRQPHRDYHHGLAPKRVTTDTWAHQSYSVVTNSLGFKDQTPRDVPLESSAPRLMFIGDSFTEGIGVPYAQTWVGLVEHALSEEGVEVLNAGVASYCPKTVYYKTKALLESGLRVDHIVFFIDVSDMPDEIIFNDFVPANIDDDDVWTGRYVKTPHIPALTEYSLIYRTLRKRQGRDPWKKTTFTDRHTGESFVFDSKERGSWTRGPKPDWLEAGQESAAYYVMKLAALCATHGLAFEIAIYPWREEIAADDAHSRYRNIWQTFGAEHQVAYYDLHDIFFPADPAARQQMLAEDFIPNDVHWNAAGHQLVGREWLRQYRERYPKPYLRAVGGIHPPG